MITTMLPMNKNHKYYAKKDTKTSTRKQVFFQTCYSSQMRLAVSAMKSQIIKSIMLKNLLKLSLLHLDRANKSFGRDN